MVSDIKDLAPYNQNQMLIMKTKTQTLKEEGNILNVHAHNNYGICSSSHIQLLVNPLKVRRNTRKIIQV